MEKVQENNSRLGDAKNNWDLLKRRKEDSLVRDLRYGYRTQAIEAELIEWKSLGADHGGEDWIGTDPQIFQTPYEELEEIIEFMGFSIEPRNWVDLGAGYGRMGLVLHERRPCDDFVGIEYVSERVDEAQRVYAVQGLDPATHQIRFANLTDEAFALPKGEIYFVYDFGDRESIETVLKKLRNLAHSQRFKVIARGGRVRDLIHKNHAWLCEVARPQHFANYSIYSTET